MAEYSSDSSEEGSLTSLSSSELSEISSSSEADDSDEEVAEVRSQRVSASRRPQSKSAKNPKLRKKTTDKRTTVKALTRDEMEQLSSWVFSVSQAKIVERELREQLLISPRIRAFEERLKIASHFTSSEQEGNFSLLNIGFCRTFATLANECYKNNVPKERKAAFAVVWMKVLCNFQNNKTTQERMILQRLVQSSSQSFPPEEIHCVLSTIHELIYKIIHDHIRKRKSDSTAEDNEVQLNQESDDTLYRYCGAAMHRMIKLRRETLAAKKNRVQLASKRRPLMVKELQLLEGLVMKDKSGLSQSLQNLDEGNLTFPREELLPFLRSVDGEVREFTNDKNLSKYQSNFLRMCQNCVTNNQSLENDFSLLVGSLLNIECVNEETVVCGIFKEIVSKMANTRINEFMNAKSERDLKKQGKVVDADEMLRPQLKSYAVVSKRKRSS